MTGTGTRTVLVPVVRLPGWVERFAARHGEVARTERGTSVTLTAADGAEARLDEAPVPSRFGLLLVRRGGYAVGLVDDGALTAHKSGTRYVQGQTKAGGWSQQRYARRRANQADELVQACAGHADRLFAGADGLAVVGGGDRALVRQVVDEMRTSVDVLPRHLDVPDPRHRVLVDAVASARSVEITLNDLA
ncbi:acVLRF1 family peptidyl-tRNA hydrolase [Solicola sp. PLA-1-18]|uniref:acVLRF1 family peptidyl-tRNA hydrolase n=1 Tax=Solicola sp. PLA-1-18 TaxID=3380532 RepID=UPI003B794C06